MLMKSTSVKYSNYKSLIPRSFCSFGMLILHKCNIDHRLGAFFSLQHILTSTTDNNQSSALPGSIDSQLSLERLFYHKRKHKLRFWRIWRNGRETQTQSQFEQPATNIANVPFASKTTILQRRSNVSTRQCRQPSSPSSQQWWWTGLPKRRTYTQIIVCRSYVLVTANRSPTTATFTEESSRILYTRSKKP